MSNGLRVTYLLNSAPVHNSGHTTGKKRVMANNVKWTESNLHPEFSTSAQQWTHNMYEKSNGEQSKMDYILKKRIIVSNGQVMNGLYS